MKTKKKSFFFKKWSIFFIFLQKNKEMQHKKDLTICIKGKLIDFSSPKIMGIVNFTTDSFYDKSRGNIGALKHADIIDIGACSTRPGSTPVDKNQERRQLKEGLELVRKEFPKAIISVDTFRSSIAQWALEERGVDIINDVSGGMSNMFETVAKYNVPYVLTYSENGFSHDMMLFFSKKLEKLYSLGVADVILDPGFGFNKTMEQNFEIAKNLDCLKCFNLPILVGISRKSMVQFATKTNASTALNGTTALNSFLLSKGANILRVHDTKEAKEVISIYKCMNDL
jgi:dihydropteroate synthase